MFKYFLASAIFLSSVGLSLAQDGSIGVSFNRNGNEPFAAGVSAGAVPQTNWNMTTPTSSGNGSLGAGSVVDNMGATVSGFQVDWTAANTWAHGPANADGNISLLKGYLDDGGNGSNIDITGVPYAQYDLYLYGIGDQGTNGTLDGYTVTAGGDAFDPDWLRAPNLSPGGTPIEGSSGVQGHYFLMEGLSSADVNIKGLSAGSPGRAPIAGFQIVDTTPAAVPEPASIAIWSLLGLCLAGYGYRRRYKNS